MIVQLRRPEISDWVRIHEWTSRPESCRFQAWGPNTAEQTRSFTEAAVASWDAGEQRARYVWAAVTADHGVVGLGELHVTDHQHRQGDISYSVHTDYWRRGIAKAIGRDLLRIGFDEQDLHRIVGTCDPRNLASSLVLRSLGMSYEGRARDTLLLRDGWRDSDVFSILEDEWRSR